MENIFAVLVINSLLAVPFVAAILLLRVLIRRLPKIYIHILWILLLVELVMPPLVTSPLGLKAAWGSRQEGEVQGTAPGNVGLAVLQNILMVPGNGMGGLADGMAEDGKQGEDVSIRGQGEMPEGNENGEAVPLWQKCAGYLPWVWLAGVCVLLAVYLLEYSGLKKRTALAIRTGKKIWEISCNETPFVMPGFPCRIYLPADLSEDEQEDILAHERQHIRYGDPWVKVFGCFVLALHWFNPFVWIGVRYLGKDMEMLCDERVLKGKTLEEKKRYSETLLHFSVRRNGITPALSFGESNTESRIRHILYSRKPKWVVSVLLFAVIAVCAAVFLTTSGQQGTGGPQEGTPAGEDQNGAFGGSGGTGSQGGNVPEPGNDGENGGDGNGTQSGTDNGGKDGRSAGLDARGQEEQEHWPSMPVVGEVFVPDTAMLEKLENAADFSAQEDWNTLPWLPEGEPSTSEEQQLYDAVNLIGRTEHFKLYGTGSTERMFLEVPGGIYIRMEIPSTSNYRIQPELQELDYDGDGEEELSIVLLVLHGTGVYINTLLMADNAGDGGWKVYQYMDDTYLEELSGHFLTQKAGEGVRLLVDGQAMGRADRLHSQEDDYAYYAGSQITFETTSGGIVLKAKLEGQSSQTIIGDFSMGHELDADVVYQGGGEWRLNNVRYRESMLEEQVNSIAAYYYLGDEERLNEYCAAEGYRLEAAGGSDGYTGAVVVRRITYDAETVEGGEVTAVAEVLPEGGDSFDYLNLDMVYESMADGEGSWKVRGIALEK